MCCKFFLPRLYNNPNFATGYGTKLQKYDSLKDIPFHEFCFKDFKEIQLGKSKIDTLYGEVILFGIFTAPFNIFMITF